jgi:hypothetical protein
MTLNDELQVIDETLAELENRRIEIINQMERVKVERSANRDTKVIQFPRLSVTVSTYRAARHVW